MRATGIDARKPNLLLIITDQQRYPRHWPEEPGWLEQLTPSDTALARTGLSFTNFTVNSCMCSPSRATLFTGLYPSEHGVTLTLTGAGARPNPRNVPAVIRAFARMIASGEVPRAKAARAFGRSAARRRANAGVEPELRPETHNLARMLSEAGYEVAYKGKWHLTKPLRGEWSAADAERLEREFGFAGWQPPDAGEDIEPEHFGGGTAGPSGAGWDEDFTRQAESFIAAAREPFALIVSLVNPHDVLAYPSSYARGGYSGREIRELGVQLPVTADEDLSGKPSPHALMKLGQAAYLGPLSSNRERALYVNFYAHLCSLVDAKIGRLLSALGDPGDPGSLRARTIVLRTSDHGEMGLAHGGLRQKMFNAYEETLRVPLVVSNPLLFPSAATTATPASLIDLMPTVATLTGGDPGDHSGTDLTPLLARHAVGDAGAPPEAGVDLTPVLETPPAESVRDGAFFFYDDHKAGTAFENVIPQPNRVRCVRERRWKYAFYFDPGGAVPTEYELYDLEEDPLEQRNLVDRASGAAGSPRLEDERLRLHEALLAEAGAHEALPDRIAP